MQAMRSLSGFAGRLGSSLRAGMHTQVGEIIAPAFRPWLVEPLEMGKHDPRTRRGKVFNGTFGKSRPKKKPLQPWDPRSLADPLDFVIPYPPKQPAKKTGL